jgi:hypothetical protein
VASTGLERKAYWPLGSEHPGQSRGMDIARNILATSLDRRKANRMQPSNATFAVFLGGGGATTGHIFYLAAAVSQKDEPWRQQR